MVTGRSSIEARKRKSAQYPPIHSPNSCLLTSQLPLDDASWPERSSMSKHIMTYSPDPDLGSETLEGIPTPNEIHMYEHKHKFKHTHV